MFYYFEENIMFEFVLFTNMIYKKYDNWYK